MVQHYPDEEIYPGREMNPEFLKGVLNRMKEGNQFRNWLAICVLNNLGVIDGAHLLDGFGDDIMILASLAREFEPVSGSDVFMRTKALDAVERLVSVKRHQEKVGIDQKWDLREIIEVKGFLDTDDDTIELN